MRLLAFFALLLSASVLANAPLSRADIEGALRANNPEQLAQLLNRLHEATGDSSELGFQRGLIQLKREQYEAAMASFSVIPPTSSFYLDARNNMAAIYAVQGKLPEAKSILEASLRAHLTLDLIHRNLDNLRVHLASKNYSSALQILDPSKGSKLQLVVSTGGSTPVSPRFAPESKADLSVPAKTVASAARTVDKPHNKHEVGTSTSVPDTEQTRAAVLALQAWAQAWEKKDMERYFKAYAPDFTPADGKSHDQWVNDRKTRILSKGHIMIQIKQVEAKVVDPQRIELRYRQHYQADQLKVASDKTVEMKWDGQQWLIASERAVESRRK